MYSNYIIQSIHKVANTSQHYVENLWGTYIQATNSSYMKVREAFILTMFIIGSMNYLSVHQKHEGKYQALLGKSHSERVTTTSILLLVNTWRICSFINSIMSKEDDAETQSLANHIALITGLGEVISVFTIYRDHALAHLLWQTRLIFDFPWRKSIQHFPLAVFEMTLPVKALLALEDAVITVWRRREFVIKDAMRITFDKTFGEFENKQNFVHWYISCGVKINEQSLLNHITNHVAGNEHKGLIYTPMYAAIHKLGMHHYLVSYRGNTIGFKNYCTNRISDILQCIRKYLGCHLVLSSTNKKYEFDMGVRQVIYGYLSHKEIMHLNNTAKSIHIPPVHYELTEKVPTLAIK